MLTKECEIIYNYFSRVLMVTNNLKINKGKYDDVSIMEKFLRLVDLNLSILLPSLKRYTILRP